MATARDDYDPTRGGASEDPKRDDGFDDTAAAEAHRDLVGQPHPRDEPAEIVAAEAEAARLSSAEHPLGRPGPRFNRRSPFVIGMSAAAGVAVTYGLVQIIISARQVLILVLVSFFVAAGIEPAVSWLVKHHVPRWAAICLVYLIFLAAVGGFLAAAIPPLIDQASELIQHGPDRLQSLLQHNSWLKNLSDRFHLEDKLRHGFGGGLPGGVIGVGQRIFSDVANLVIGIVLTIYFSANFPRLRAALYRLFPAARRPRAILIGDEIFAKVGGYVLGNLLISLITAIATYIWLMAFGMPYPLLLAVMVAVLDLIPVIGSTVAGLIIALVALTVSIPVSIATVGFFIIMRLVEDYVLVPKIIGRTVHIPAVATVVAVLIGGVLLGIIGALLAIPIAAALLLLAEQTLLPRLDRSKREPS
ncbi:AI-2E family transporter [Skermania sp. ID1734]|uniref:AI-2E family transporter n=1 Tax=Skermania sp. ID1734 TaxID=2597516 RepID=UPI00117C07E2|nr:AI-2E family transporter [Skermania sp. ID1734]TSD99332.1 AI-2E family transporter [Skermania sp. ID1734]